jgi:hypothetical protein
MCKAGLVPDDLLQLMAMKSAIVIPLYYNLGERKHMTMAILCHVSFSRGGVGTYAKQSHYTC